MQMAGAALVARPLVLPTVEQMRNQPASATAAQILSQKLNMTDPATREAVGRTLKTSAELRKKAAWEKAVKLGLPTSGDKPGGGRFELQDFDENGRPLYHQTTNVNAAVTTAAHQVRLVYPGYPVDGGDMESGIPMVIGMWEAGGTPRYSHVEFDYLGGNSGSSKISQQDASLALMDRHATHVAATLAGTGGTVVDGVLGRLRGMASGAFIDAYDSTGDLGEMVLAGAVNATDLGSWTVHRLNVSNHSYGYDSGWTVDRALNSIWLGYLIFGTPSDIDQNFGRYDSDSAAVDGVVANCPYYLPFFAAGNERTDGPPAAGAVWYQFNATNPPKIYTPGRDPVADGVYKGGYDTIPHGKALGKNVMTVGAVAPAVTDRAVLNGNRVINESVMTDFSSWGPADDGRIKPDIVADGYRVLSASHEADDASALSDGTSMATPNACGSALLLQNLHVRMFGEAMSASMLKGLIIHTADDRGPPGPDYKYGWGLMNTRAAADVMNSHRQLMNSVAMTKGLATSNSRQEFPITLNGSNPLRVTLCWTDPPSANDPLGEDANPDLVNNLELEVIGPDGTTIYRPYVMPFVAARTQASLSQSATTGVNNVDNVEQVYLSLPAAGEYKVAVYTGALQNNEPQDYSLIITGDAPSPEITVEDADGNSLVDGESAVSLGSAAPDAIFSQTKSFTIGNIGPGPLTGLAVTAEGADANGFIINPPVDTSIGTGGSTTFSVTFYAEGWPPGLHIATLHVQSNDRDERPFDIQVAAVRESPVPARLWRVPVPDETWSEMVALDPGGNVIVAGVTNSSNLDPQVTKLSAASGATLWRHTTTTQHGGTNLDEGLAGMRVDPNGDVLISTGAEVDAGALLKRARTFTTKLASATGQFVWDRSIDHDTYFSAQVPYTPYVQGAIDVDAAGNVLLASSASDYHIDNHLVRTFLVTTKYSPGGDTVWQQDMRNISPDLFQLHGVDGSGNFFLNKKYAANTGLPVWTDGQLDNAHMHAVNASGQVAFVTHTYQGATVTRLSAAGTIDWTSTFDELPDSVPYGRNYEYATGVAIDAQGNVFVLGSQWRIPQGARVFLAKFSSAGGQMAWLSHYQSPDGTGTYYPAYQYFTGDFSNHLKLDSFGNPVISLNTYVGRVAGYNGWSYSPIFFWGLQKYSANNGSRVWDHRGDGETSFTESSFAAGGSGKVAFIKAYPQVEVMLFNDLQNTPPSVSLVHSTVTVDEGQPATNAGTFIDPDLADTVTLTATKDSAGLIPIGSVTVNQTASTWEWSLATQDGPDQSGTVFINASDGVNPPVVTSFPLVVRNVAPAFVAGADISIRPAAAIGFQHIITFTDPGPDVWTATVNFGAGDQTLPVEQTTKSLTLNHTFTSAGYYPVSVTVSDGDPGGSTTHIFTVTVMRHISDWRVTHFSTSENTGDAADDADADSDGIPNLAEFAFNLDPKKSDGSGLPSISFGNSITSLLGESEDSGALDPKASGNLGAGDQMTISFAEPPATTGIIYGAEYSSNLTSWTSITDTGSGGTHTFSVPVSTNTRLFMRLKVTTVP